MLALNYIKANDVQCKPRSPNFVMPIFAKRESPGNSIRNSKSVSVLKTIDNIGHIAEHPDSSEIKNESQILREHAIAAKLKSKKTFRKKSFNPTPLTKAMPTAKEKPSNN